NNNGSTIPHQPNPKSAPISRASSSTTTSATTTVSSATASSQQHHQQLSFKQSSSSSSSSSSNQSRAPSGTCTDFTTSHQSHQPHPAHLNESKGNSSYGRVDANFTNLSSITLTPAQESVLSLGLNFVPIPKPATHQHIMSQWDQFQPPQESLQHLKSVQQ